MLDEVAYTAYGLTIASQIPLPELARAPAGAPADVRITLGKAPEALPGAHIVRPTYQVAGGEGEAPRLLLHAPGIARFLVEGGRHIVIDPASGGDEALLRTILFATPFGALLQMRGLLVLSASAVCADGGAVAFCGLAASGKSLAAYGMAQHGWRVAADCPCAVDMTDGAAVLPGPPAVRLWRHTLGRLGRRPDPAWKDGATVERYRISVAGADTAAPLRRIYVLEQDLLAASPQVEPLDVGGAAGAILKHLYWPPMASALGLEAQNFASAVSIASAVPAVRLVWRPGRRWLDSLAELVGEPG